VAIRRDELEYIPALDFQRAENASIFGGGFLTTRAKGAELDEARRQADEARRRVWKLSPREQEIIDKLEKRQDEKKQER
jgi:aryl-alcohol dehydrogenase-like predicted oxidoreductase